MEKILKKVQERQGLLLAMKIISHCAVGVSGVGYALLLVLAFRVSLWYALETVLFTFIPFVIVSAVRKLINAPRPYELYDFYTMPTKSKKGASFPSRHAYSAFVIGCALLYVCAPFGIVVFAFAVLMSACRVLLGIHFVRDVLCGALAGVLSALLGNLIFTHV